MLISLGKAERELESYRQILCTAEEFNVWNAFERLDRKQKGRLSLKDVVAYLLENNDKVSIESAQSLISFYDLDGDGKWTLDEFKNMLIPCERRDLEEQLDSRPYIGPLENGQYLEELQEVNMRCLISKEV